MTLELDLTTDQILALIKQLPENERESLVYQLRKEEGINGLIKLKEEIQAELGPDDAMSMDEIVAEIKEVRKERQLAKKAAR